MIVARLRKAYLAAKFCDVSRLTGEGAPKRSDGGQVRSAWDTFKKATPYPRDD